MTISYSSTNRAISNLKEACWPGLSFSEMFGFKLGVQDALSEFRYHLLIVGESFQRFNDYLEALRDGKSPCPLIRRQDREILTDFICFYRPFLFSEDSLAKKVRQEIQKKVRLQDPLFELEPSWVRSVFKVEIFLRAEHALNEAIPLHQVRKFVEGSIEEPESKTLRKWLSRLPDTAEFSEPQAIQSLVFSFVNILSVDEKSRWDLLSRLDHLSGRTWSKKYLDRTEVKMVKIREKALTQGILTLASGDVKVSRLSPVEEKGFYSHRPIYVVFENEEQLVAKIGCNCLSLVFERGWGIKPTSPLIRDDTGVFVYRKFTILPQDFYSIDFSSTLFPGIEMVDEICRFMMACRELKGLPHHGEHHKLGFELDGGGNFIFSATAPLRKKMSWSEKYLEEFLKVYSQENTKLFRLLMDRMFVLGDVRGRWRPIKWALGDRLFEISQLISEKWPPEISQNDPEEVIDFYDYISGLLESMIKKGFEGHQIRLGISRWYSCVGARTTRWTSFPLMLEDYLNGEETELLAYIEPT